MIIMQGPDPCSRTHVAVVTSRRVAKLSIVIIDDNQVSIIDVTCPFENDSDGHRTAEQENIAKYDHLKDHYIAQGKN